MISSIPGVNAVATTTKKAAKVANPLDWFGDDKSEQEAAAASKIAEPRPESASIGSVHMVDHRHDFLLIRSSRNASIEYDTPLISQSPNGQQSAELKLSPERKGAFLVADIIKGSPSVGDLVKLVGATDAQTGGVVPIVDDEVQVLE